MKILVLIGSYRKNGNTSQITDLIAKHLGSLAAQNNVPLDIETVYLGEQNITACHGCRVCFDRGEDKCPLKDGFLALKAKMKQVDGILVASPVYVNDVSGITKNWIDRLAHVCHRPEFAGKCAFLVATVGSSPTSHSLRTLNLALSTWGFYIAGQAGFKMGALMKPEETETSYLLKAKKIAQQFFTAIHKCKFARPTFFSLMMFKIQQLAWYNAPQDTVDYQYWKNTGWLDPARDYYIAHNASRLKVILARLTGALIARFVS
jgi:multimeric flavodoxin WrbA